MVIFFSSFSTHLSLLRLSQRVQTV